jgi:hypothetical protein
MSYVRIWTPPLIALFCVLFFLYEEHAFNRHKQTSWTTAPAVVEDTRLRPIARFALQYGSKPLYETDVLATYTVNGTPHKDWLPLSESPKPGKDAQAEATALKGKQCFVRWDPATPDQKIVELR